MKKAIGIIILGLFWCNVGFADAASAKQACRDIGFEPGTEQFSDCALKLMLQEKQSNQSITLKQDSDRDEVAWQKAMKIYDECHTDTLAVILGTATKAAWRAKWTKGNCIHYKPDPKLYPNRTSDK